MRNFIQRICLLVAILLSTIGWISAQAILQRQGFENNGAIPTDWTQQHVNGEIDLQFVSSVANYLGTNCKPKLGDYMVYCPSANQGDTRLISNQIDISKVKSVQVGVDFVQGRNTVSNDDQIIVQYSFDGNNWTDLGTIMQCIGNTSTWWCKWTWQNFEFNINSSMIGNHDHIYISFLFLSRNGPGLIIDNVIIKGEISTNLTYSDTIVYHGQTNVQLTARGADEYIWRDGFGNSISTSQTYTIPGLYLEQPALSVEGKITSLHNVMDENDDYEIGDIITQDGFLVKPNDWDSAANAGKTAIAVVFFKNYQGVFIVYYKDLNAVIYGPDRESYWYVLEASSYSDGYNNNERLKECTHNGTNYYYRFDASKNCANLTAGGFNDWYLPARNELVYLMSVRPNLNSVLTRSSINGDNLNKKYWSSTSTIIGDEYTNSGRHYRVIHAAVVDQDGNTSHKWRRESYSVRPIRRIKFDSDNIKQFVVDNRIVLDSVLLTKKMPYIIKDLEVKQNLLDTGQITLTWKSTNYLKSPLTYDTSSTRFVIDVMENSQVIYSKSVDWNPTDSNYSTMIGVSSLTCRTDDSLAKTYTYRISQRTAENINYIQRSMRTSVKPKRIAMTSIETDTNDHSTVIRWTMTPDGYASANNVRINARATQGASLIENDEIIYVDQLNVNLPSCAIYNIDLDLYYPSYSNNRYQRKNVSPGHLVPPENTYAISNLVCSKGYYSNRVDLSWSKVGNFSSFILERKELGQPDNMAVILTEIPTTNSSNYTYVDNNAQLGLYYIYTVKGMLICGNDNAGVADIKSDIGFSRAAAVVSGHVLYGSGQAVKDVQISALADNQDVVKNRALHFPEDATGDAYTSIEIPYPNTRNELEHFSIQLHVKPEPFSSEEFPFRSFISFIDFSFEEKYYELVIDSSHKLSFEIFGGREFGSLQDPIEVARLYSNTSIPTNAYTAVALTSSYERDSITLSLYLNGVLDTSIRVSFSGFMFEENPDENYPNAHFSINGGRNTVCPGYIDEIRFWGKTLTSEEIAQNWNAYLNGNETKLNAYYRCDEPIDVYINKLFDLSAVGANFNKRDAQIVGHMIQRVEDNVPPVELLGHRASTNSDGYYLMKTMPYTTSGVSYTLVPSLGVHWFNPIQHSFYVSPQSAVFNNIDFSDESAFEVTGTIYYTNTDYPVEGCNFYIDGQLVSNEGEPVTSDAQGKYSIRVPIGKHSFQVRKDGHTFDYDGRFPIDIDSTSAVTKYDFHEPLRDINFYDNTTVPLIGRVVGGAIQDAYDIGFGKSKANIGRANIQLSLQTDLPYNLNTTGSRHYYESMRVRKIPQQVTTRDSVLNAIDSTYTAFDTTYVMMVPDTVIYSEAFIESYPNSYSNIITINTDYKTGEFIAKLPPIPFKVIKLSTEGLTSSELGISDIAPFTLKPSGVTYRTDSLPNGVVDSVKYSKELKITYYNPMPSFLVHQVGAPHPDIFGDTSFIYRDETVDSLNIPLVILDSGNYSYTLRYPIFTQQKLYHFEFQGFEAYTNQDNPFETIVDTVPLQDVVVTVANELGRLQAAIDTLRAAEVPLNENQVTLNSEGKAIYTFLAGFPRITGDYLLDMNIVYNKNGKDYQWEKNNGGLRGYVMGDMPKGNDFVTAGPEIIHTIIRDPGGGGSYGYMAENTSFSSSKTFSTSYTNETATSVVCHLGLKTALATGVGIAVISEMNGKDDLTAGVKFTYSYEGNTVKTTMSTNSHKVSTSNSPEFVGAMGDVFVGSSTNTIIGGASNIGIRKIEGASFSDNVSVDSIIPYLHINKEDVISVGLEFKTTFNYTQGHIINTLIPEYKELIRNSLIVIESDRYQRILHGLETYPLDPSVISPVYITALSPTDERFGSANNDVTIWHNDATPSASSTGPSYIMVMPEFGPSSGTDQINYFNSQIKQWEAAVKFNEKDKLVSYLNDEYIINNYSFNSGAIIEHSSSTCMEARNSSSNTYNGGLFFHNELGVSINGFGMTWTVDENNYGGTSDGSESTTDTCTEYGYVFTDEDSDNYLSIDVYKSAYGWGPIFRTRGGATSCPYESGSQTLYYNPGTVLDAPTVQIQRPEISTNNPFVTGIPNGNDAIYSVTLANASDVNGNADWYTLRVLDETNPDGAIILMDGAPLTGTIAGREVFITRDAAVNKTLVLRQSNTSVTDYNNIKIVLMSTCQNDPSSNNPVIADTLSISAQFVPTCTDVNIQIENRIVNTRTDGILPITINGYDRNVSNFASVKLEYKGVNENDWTLVKEFVNDTTGFGRIVPLTDNYEFMTGSSVIYNFDMTNLTDKKYQFRAVTYCRFGVDWINNESNIIEVVKDTRPPSVFGYPQPGDGILSSGDEVSITFNEAINSNILYASNFSIKGVLNGATSTNTVGLSFDGTGNAYTELPVHLENTSFTIEGWVKHTPGTAGTLFSIGEGDKILSFGFNSDNTLFASYDNNTITSSNTASYNEWQYMVFGLIRLDSMCQVTAFTKYGNTEVVLFAATDLAALIENDGPFYIGSEIDGSNGFIGLVRDVQIWNTVRNTAEVTQTMNVNKSGNEAGMLGYWKLDEAIGTVASDKARSRHLTIQTDWYYPNGKSLSLNGSPVSFVSNDIPINSTKDYSIEFWFKANAQNATLFSCGRGLGDFSGREVSDKLSVAMTDNGSLILRTNGNQFPISTNVGDNRWHHFAMTMKRNSQTMVYVDGNQKINTASANVGALASNEIYLGGCHYVPNVNEPNTFVTTEPYIGLIDEVRVWESFLPLDVIKQNMSTKMDSAETGLLVYYPFEKHDYEQTPTAITPINYSMATSTSGRALTGAVAYSNETPAIKSERFEENVAFNWTASDNKIIFTLNEPVNNIEKCFLNFTTTGVQDINGNIMESASKWTAYVNMNTLKWTEDNIRIEKDVAEEYTFTTTISNTGGTVEYYSLSQLPSWLSASSYQGTINPLSTQEITFIVSDAVAIGNYEAGIALSGNNNYNEILKLSLKVTGNQPNWVVNPSEFTSSMNIIGQIKIQDEYQRDPEDMVAAFYGQRCLGVAKPQFMLGQYYVFMDVYGDSTVNLKRLTFKYWDASTGTIYARINVTPIIYYQVDAIYGTITNPVLFRVTDDVTQTYSLQNGWNWVSTYIETTPNSLSDLEDGLGSFGMMIKSQNEFLQPIYDSTQSYVWIGSANFTNISNETMYMIQTNQNCGLELSGSLALPADHDITLHHGWTWIGYVPSNTLSINDALAGINPQINDIFKGQQGFSTYVGGSIGWIGSLTALYPGKGYMYKSQNPNDITFTYPTLRNSTEPTQFSLDNEQQNLTYWQTNPYQYSGSMSMTVVVEIDSVEQTDTIWELGAFVGNECRGTVQLSYYPDIERYLGFLTVYGDLPTNVDLRLYNHSSATAMNYAVSPTILFEQNAVYGSPLSPYVASFISAFYTDLQTSICEGESYTVADYQITTSGTHTLNLLAHNGLDSIVTLSLTINPNYELVIEDTICVGEDYSENGFDIMMPAIGVIHDTLSEISMTGCDSVIRLILTVKELPHVTISGPTEIPIGESAVLTASGANSYYWSTGETSAQITVSPTEETTFSVIGTDVNGCVSEESVITMRIVSSISDFIEDNYFIYPNPANSKVVVEGDNIQEIGVYNVVGQLVLTRNTIQSDCTEIKIAHLQSGVYMFRIITKDAQTITKRVIVTH